ncbi:MAG: T9SS type A sorting domain-containing protein [Sphingobacteriales bacterium]|nr:MAG: T9SS type A sorting domain-containing protein [Sphingobacteriales bacterium]
MAIRSTLLLLAAGLTLQANAQIFTVTDIMYNGPDTNRINIVMLPDGFTGAQMSSFITNAGSMNTALFNQTPFLNYKNFFNTYAIEAPSVQSGTDHPGTATDVTEPVIPVKNVNTAFGSTFDYGNIHRLLVPTDDPAIFDALNNNKPEWDQAVVLVNTTEYGGSGGTFATGSINSSANEIIIHEMGHSFAGLADEYWYYGYEAPNLTQDNNAATIKWKNWLGTPGIGIFPHGNTLPMSDWFKPSQGCKMEALFYPFCNVCREAILERIYTLTTPIEQALPDRTVTVNDPTAPVDFSLQLVLPIPNTLTTQWLLNNNVINNGSINVQVSNLSLNSGDNILTAIVTDTTELSRSYRPATGYQFSVSWKLHVAGGTSVKEISASNKFFYQVYPNPATTTLNLYCNNQSDAESIACNVYSVDGKLVKRFDNALHNGKQVISFDISSLATGNYLLKFQGKGILFDTRLTKE